MDQFDTSVRGTVLTPISVHIKCGNDYFTSNKMYSLFFIRKLDRRNMQYFISYIGSKIIRIILQF